MGFDAHTHFVSVADAIGSAGCPIPDCGHSWIPTLPPVVLEQWPVAHHVETEAATTVGHWRSYGSIHYQGLHFGQRAHSLRTIVDLPRRTPTPLVLALGIHPDETGDLTALEENGWTLIDPDEVARLPQDYARFVRGSWAELGVAKAGYVVSGSGWFSDRSACYLASGRPVVAQDTGFGRRLPVGAGLLAFSSADDAVGGAGGDRGRLRPPSRRGARGRGGAPGLGPRPRVAAGGAGAVTTGLSDRDLLELARERCGVPPDAALERSDYRYATSAPLEELRFTAADGAEVRLILKDLNRGRLLGKAAGAKPEFLHEPGSRGRDLPPHPRARLARPSLRRGLDDRSGRGRLAAHREGPRGRAVAGGRYRGVGGGRSPGRAGCTLGSPRRCDELRAANPAPARARRGVVRDLERPCARRPRRVERFPRRRAAAGP